MEQSKIGCSNFSLKMIAIVTMLIDHVGCILYPQDLIFRYIGRISFPIFCFLLVEGFFHTRNRKRYLLQMLIFAVISEIPFDIAFSNKLFEMQSQNIFWTLTIGLLVLYLLQQFSQKGAQLAIMAGGIVAATLLHTDYGGGGIIIILVLYLLYDRKWLKFLLLALSLWLLYGGFEWFGIVAILPLLLYNGKRGPGLKYVFYFFYPCHLLILHMIALR